MSAYQSSTTSSEQPNTIRLKLSMKNETGSLLKVLKLLSSELSINISQIESIPGAKKSHCLIFIDFIQTQQFEDIKLFESELRSKLPDDQQLQVWLIPWFPRSIEQLDLFNNKTLDFSSELDNDHPGFSDQKYRARRKEIVEFAKKYKYAQTIPKIEYTQEENETWGVVYQRLKSLFDTHACKQHIECFEKLEKAGVYSAQEIPQLEEVSQFLRSQTGFSLRPVQGLLSPRDFLNGLAFKVFHATQYIRHSSKPLYTPEPDVCHELLGHVPLFADPEFADFSQQIGLASLGASENDITRLATCYWFTVEFGLCKENSSLRAFGAGLLSSVGELQYSLTDKPKLLPFDPTVAAQTTYITTAMQPLYFVAESFEASTHQMKQFAATLDRPFDVLYSDSQQTVRTRIHPDFEKKIENGIRLDNLQSKVPPPAWC
eukprot:CAMPEP_0201557254 /NCGR_PEP_ID=MMETSP0173_2-20130828/60607_1 /ASSEMBLY_ACC=CAM_ASM_000268 /TAXON_ID=218659 /ORGANISM="Vexillifera sp., Strain DIVA3 564/2" /LENGTH=430 /DNA_ID=CAMNT_0047970005 /DNA_START=36 /DNA_END=1328 /DNA_ORIENTATION=-